MNTYSMNLILDGRPGVVGWVGVRNVNARVNLNADNTIVCIHNFKSNQSIHK